MQRTERPRYFNNCKIESVDRAAFEGMGNTLRRLSFFYNKLLEFPFSEILSQMTRLEVLDLGGNDILHLPLLVCPQTMIELHLYRNNISTIPEYAFRECSSLQVRSSKSYGGEEMPFCVDKPLKKEKLRNSESLSKRTSRLVRVFVASVPSVQLHRCKFISHFRKLSQEATAVIVEWSSTFRNGIRRVFLSQIYRISTVITINFENFPFLSKSVKLLY